MLSVIMLSIFMLSIFMLSVFMLSVIMLSIFMLNVVMLSVVAPYEDLKISWVAALNVSYEKPKMKMIKLKIGHPYPKIDLKTTLWPYS
jgi:hypothetical protein